MIIRMFLILFIWIVIEIIRYIRYRIVCDVLNKIKNPNGENQLDHNMKKYFEDMVMYPELCWNNFKYIDNGYDLSNIHYDSFCEYLHYLTSYSPKYVEIIKRAVKVVTKYYESIDVRILDPKLAKTSDKTFGQTSGQTLGSNFVKLINELRCSYQIIPIDFLKTLYRMVINIWMSWIGYKCRIYPNRMVIWYIPHDPLKKSPLLFYSIDPINPNLLYGLTNYNIIIPEIPDIRLFQFETPLSIGEIVDTTMDFLKYNYVDSEKMDEVDSKLSKKFEPQEPNDLKINIMGYGLGNNVCCSLINRYSTYVNNFISIEGQIFTNSGLNRMSGSKDLFVQYFSKRLVRIDEGFIYDLSQYPHIKIQMFFLEHHTVEKINSQIEYARKKQIPIKYFIFVTKSLMNIYVMNELKIIM